MGLLRAVLLLAGIAFVTSATLCYSDADCRASQPWKTSLYCKKSGCSATTRGYCEDSSTTQCVSDLNLYVCGCDGETYYNPCSAQTNGVNIAYATPCASPPTPAPVFRPPGSDCGADSECLSTYYCQKPSCDPEARGACVRAEGFSCPITPTPVCGCNGVTYLNYCQATQFRATVSFNNSCEAGPSASSGSHLQPLSLVGGLMFLLFALLNLAL
eukprot:TRINITY_DN415_c0_g1_i4.p1 TRINITY_DN415_c0_g1~~TRINITY_DN415_c0_g1_i4.p1  ORF type:complete len:214 (-),score=23.15 TRINITY_DN415_c0_g1_i4:116-757(-)